MKYISGPPTPGSERLSRGAWGDIEALAKAVCRCAGVEPDYCYGVDIDLGRVTFHLWRGRDGRCKGPKFVGADGEAVRETVVYELPSREEREA